MKLLSIQFLCSLPDNLGSSARLNMREPTEPLRGFTVAIRGPIVWLVSPPGWSRALVSSPHSFDPRGPRQIYSIPFSQCMCKFEGAEVKDVDGLVNYTSEPAQRPPPEPTEEELEQATAPKAAARR